LLTGIASASLVGCGALPHQPGLRLRAATDVNEKHILAATLKRFMDALAGELPDSFRAELFSSGQLFYDRDMAKALFRGDLDLAAPNMTSLSRLVPACNLISLPFLYGQPAEATHRLTDGRVGDQIVSDIQAKLGVRVLRPFVDLGFVDLFCNDLANAARGEVGQKIRIPSGTANALRLNAMGAIPLVMPFADVPIALSQGVVDAIESTAQTVQTTQLWDSGIVACRRTNAMFQKYVPMVSQRFWQSLSPQQRDVFLHHWQESATWARKEAAARQAKTLTECAANGFRIINPTPDDVARARSILLRAGDRIAARVGISSDLVNFARRELAL
jgi:C4-dicarboxylate-binding protein DctP